MAELLGSISYPPSLDESSTLTTTLRDWALSHGLVIRAPIKEEDADERATHVPLTLFPSPFPKKLFEEARGLQTAFNELYVNVANDSEFLNEITKGLAGVDDFMSDLWKLHLEVEKETGGKPTQPLTLGVFRSDYLLHTSPSSEPEIRQVELNTISASFGGLSSLAADAHRFLLKADEYPTSQLEMSNETMPENPSAKGLAAGLATAHNAYGVPSAVVLFVIQPGERNAFDQRWLEYYLLETHGVRVLRASMQEIAADGKLDATTKKFSIYGKEISVVYYRSAYTPADYPTPETWQARKQMELSTAIKCPSLATQFAGAKKVQQVLVDSKVLEKFCPDTAVRARIAATFAEILPLDADSALGKRARELIATKPEKYVLKPQREGGGNNVYREKIPGFLKSLPDESFWNGYILMELIEPPTDVKNSIIRNGKVTTGNVISELGVFGTALWNTVSGEILDNSEAGWLLRTKFAESEEGGVAAGFGSIDSVLLI
ncbi:glutathione synthase [Myxozyma melibiosi]|uniref:Glutathione synthetase n=1 Tax=Myxozyma melibiosi TaxID=54550 RepID=A0ABR1F5H5_9ASCO